jgi:hypothetical protein
VEMFATTPDERLFDFCKIVVVVQATMLGYAGQRPQLNPPILNADAGQHHANPSR